MPSDATKPLFRKSKELGIALSFGYAELTPDGSHYNTSILTDKRGNIIGKYRKVHLPGHSEYDHDRAFQHLEKRYFLPGDMGFPVFRNLNAIMGMCICNDVDGRSIQRDGFAGCRTVNAWIQHPISE